MSRRSGHIAVGDHVPIVPVHHFTREKHDLKAAWRLVGPTIQRNYANSNPQDLYCIAFIEGMRMAFGIMKETEQGERPCLQGD